MRRACLESSRVGIRAGSNLGRVKEHLGAAVVWPTECPPCRLQPTAHRAQLFHRHPIRGRRRPVQVGVKGARLGPRSRAHSVGGAHAQAKLFALLEAPHLALQRCGGGGTPRLPPSQPLCRQCAIHLQLRRRSAVAMATRLTAVHTPRTPQERRLHLHSHPRWPSARWCSCVQAVGHPQGPAGPPRLQCGRMCSGTSSPAVCQAVGVQ